MNKGYNKILKQTDPVVLIDLNREDHSEWLHTGAYLKGQNGIGKIRDTVRAAIKFHGASLIL